MLLTFRVKLLVRRVANLRFRRTTEEVSREFHSEQADSPLGCGGSPFAANGSSSRYADGFLSTESIIPFRSMSYALLPVAFMKTSATCQSVAFVKTATTCESVALMKTPAIHVRTSVALMKSATCQSVAFVKTATCQSVAFMKSTESKRNPLTRSFLGFVHVSILLLGLFRRRVHWLRLKFRITSNS